MRALFQSNLIQKARSRWLVVAALSNPAMRRVGSANFTVITSMLTMLTFSLLLLSRVASPTPVAASTRPLSTLQGAAATEYLKQQGLYLSLGEAVRAARGELIDKGMRSIDGISRHAYPLLPLSNFLQQAKLTANQSDGFSGLHFGVSVAISGDTAVVGNGIGIVGAYVFIRSGAAWTLQQILLPTSSAGGFGISVAISGNTIVVGAYQDNAATPNQGSAYVFVRSGTTWTQQQKLTAADGRAAARFGFSVAIGGETVVVGANDFATGLPGSAYVFVRSGTTWTQQQKLTAADGAADDDFGNSVTISGDTVVVGAPQKTSGNNVNQGSAYVFVRSGTTWTQQQKLTAVDGMAGAYFGSSVALSADTLAVGSAHGNGDSAYVFVRSGTTWILQQRLTAGAGGSIVGISVVISGDTIVVGSAFAAVGTNLGQGSAYVFVRNGATWTQQQKLTAADGAAGDNFGYSVGISGNTVIVGTYNDAIGTHNGQGSAYVFADNCPLITLNPPTLPAGTQGTAYNQPVTASGGLAPYSFSLSAGALPNGITLSSGGVLSGTPTVSGTFNFTVQAADVNGCMGAQAYTLVISCPLIQITPDFLSAGKVNSVYNQALAATGGTPSYNFSVNAGALPNGLTLASGGVLSGTPTVSGVFNFTVSATDAAGCFGTQAYTLIINAASCGTIIVNPQTLPAGARNRPYSATSFTASGGSGAYTFALTGTLPTGLSFVSGTLSGTPTQIGSFNLVITATDTAGCKGARGYTLNVKSNVIKADFDGDRKTDLSVWTPNTGNWSVLNSGNNQVQNLQWGAGFAPFNDVIVPGDYDGDGKADHAIWRGADSIWYIRKSSDGQAILQLWGTSNAPFFDIPTPGDFDGDGKTDLAVFRPATGVWFVKRSSDGGATIVTHGQNGDVPVAADYDGDGKTDFAVFRPTAVNAPNWLILQSSTNTVTALNWGAGYAPYFDVPVPADYDGDGKADLAIWRGADSIWYIRLSANVNAPVLQLWGTSNAPYFDTPCPADYDGDGKADIAVWRKDGTWFVLRSSNNTNLIQVHGQNGDTPVPAKGVW